MKRAEAISKIYDGSLHVRGRLSVGVNLRLGRAWAGMRLVELRGRGRARDGQAIKRLREEVLLFHDVTKERDLAYSK